jgi:hypothetical protein
MLSHTRVAIEDGKVSYSSEKLEERTLKVFITNDIFGGAR